jgi:hypothetical protein
MIAIEIRFGKIDQRFSFRNRSAISGSKSDPVFLVEIDPRLKNGFRNKNSDGTQNRIVIFVQKSISDFQIKIDPRFYFFQPRSDFQIKITIMIAIKNYSGKIDQRFLDQNRSLIFISKSIRH